MSVVAATTAGPERPDASNVGDVTAAAVKVTVDFEDGTGEEGQGFCIGGDLAAGGAWFYDEGWMIEVASHLQGGTADLYELTITWNTFDLDQRDEFGDPTDVALTFTRSGVNAADPIQALNFALDGWDAIPPPVKEALRSYRRVLPDTDPRWKYVYDPELWHADDPDMRCTIRMTCEPRPGAGV